MSRYHQYWALLSWQSEGANNTFTRIILAHMRSYWTKNPAQFFFMMWFLVKIEAEEFYTKYFPRHSIFETRHRQKVQSINCSNHERSVFASAVGIKTIVWKPCAGEQWYISNWSSKTTSKIPDWETPNSRAVSRSFSAAVVPLLQLWHLHWRSSVLSVGNLD
jgi:hypothetical protein